MLFRKVSFFLIIDGELTEQRLLMKLVIDPAVNSVKFGFTRHELATESFLFRVCMH